MKRARRWEHGRLVAALLLLAGAGMTWASAQAIHTGDEPPKAPDVSELQLKESVSQYGITWSFDKPVPVGQFVTGDYYVVGPATVAAITPAPGDGRNGSELNPATGEHDGYDDRTIRFKAELMAKPPISMRPGDSLVSTISHEQRRGNKHIFPHNENSASPLKTAAVLTCLEQPVPPDTFRPSYCGHQKKLYRYSDLHLELLPSVEPTESVPDLALYERVFERPWIDHVYHWNSRMIHPTENMPDYGREIGRAVSNAALLLCCNFTPEQKKKLLIGFVQYGIDLHGAIEQGLKGWPAAGGFGNGRKWPIILAGILFQDQAMQKPQAEFDEDQHTAFGKCWTGADVVFTGQCPMVGHEQIDRGPYEHLPPAEWPGPNKTMSEGYRRCCTSISYVGEALAARMMHAEKVWDHDAFFAYVDRWMTEDDTEHVKIIQEALGWDCSKPYLRQGQAWDAFVEEMWARYRNNSPSAQRGGGAMNVDSIHWYGHDAFRIEDNGKQIYFDPWNVPDGAPKADVIFVTHSHHDHYSPADVQKLSGPDTKVVGPPDVAEKAGRGAISVNPGQTITVDGLAVTAVPAYNIGKRFHPREKNWLGFLLTLSDGTTVYHAGDTDYVPEMKSLKVDIALLPVSGTYVMTADEAVEAANAFGPAVVIPMHYGTIVGSDQDAERFRQGSKGETVIKQVEE